MLMHPDFLLTMANDHHRELIAEQDRHRLLTSARAARKARKAQNGRGQPTGTLASCEPLAAVPAR
ncbi:hypothetical protein KOI35_10290 [Actinoplanes bogorensis]|uniref:Uncharacterized protein n=1 Tax=Paractinoplanes bogorensis TaxID=1610840 RepID=A0ABS5YKE0_9ACTN|nr:hypothetical protein [Actinoplanes bogorensis]MBU2663877.1 hypothetical protein [Actinoplanes bogorensis]